jgi:hypothetical protein
MKKVLSCRIIIRRLNVVDNKRIFLEVPGFNEIENELTDTYQTIGKVPKIGETVGSLEILNKESNNKLIVLIV